jgi:hypothetical protein
MNEKSLVKADNRITASKLLAMGVALCVCSGVNAQVKLPPPPKPLLLPDLVISSLSAKFIAPNRIQYSWTITNVGTGPANLEGPNPANSDNLKVQALSPRIPSTAMPVTFPRAEQLSEHPLCQSSIPKSPGAELSPPPFKQT